MAGRINCDLAALQHVDATVSEHLNYLGIQHVLNRVDMLLERVDVPALLDGHPAPGGEGDDAIAKVQKTQGKVRNIQ